MTSNSHAYHEIKEFSLPGILSALNMGSLVLELALLPPRENLLLFLLPVELLPVEPFPVALRTWALVASKSFL